MELLAKVLLAGRMSLLHLAIGYGDRLLGRLVATLAILCKVDWYLGLYVGLALSHLLHSVLELLDLELEGPGTTNGKSLSGDKV